MICHTDWGHTIELLDSIEWGSILPDDVSVDAYWSIWKTFFMQIMEICTPNAALRLKRNDPWMNHATADAIKIRMLSFVLPNILADP